MKNEADLIVFVFWVVAWVVFGMVFGRIAAKSRAWTNPADGSAIGFFLGPLALILFLVPGPPPIVKICPKCAEGVKPEAKVCRFCQHVFTEPKAPPADINMPAAFLPDPRDKSTRAERLARSNARVVGVTRH